MQVALLIERNNVEAPGDTAGGNPLEIMLGHGFSVGPLDGKIPVTAHGVQDFTRDPSVIAAWKRRYPSCNWGVTQVGVIALDVDPRNGGSVRALRLGPEHRTLTSRTGSGGWHLFYRHTGPAAGKVQGAQGIDIKVGGKGYLVAPGSIHPITGKPYRLHRDAPIADLPEHLQALIVQPSYAPPAKHDVVPRHRDRWDGLVRSVTDAQPGNRNHVLFWAAARAAADSAPAAVYSALAAAAHDIGLGAHEIRQTIQSAQRKAKAS